MTNLEVFIINPPSKYGAPNFPLKLSFLTGIADGLSYLHSKGVIHRNLTATNILLDRDLVAKISDFGNSSIVDIEPILPICKRKAVFLVHCPTFILKHAISHQGITINLMSFHLAI